MKLLSKIMLASISVMMCGAIMAQDVREIKWMTEDYPPFNYMENGKLKGICSELVTKILKRVGLKDSEIKIELLPWARSYSKVQNQNNYALFATTHSKNRHPLFKWVGPLAPTRVVVFARKDRKIVIKDPADFKKYKIGVVKDDIGELLLKELGITGKSIEKVIYAKNNIRKLNSGRIDLISYEENVTLWQMKKNGVDTKEFEIVYVLSNNQVDIAFSKNVSDKLISKLQIALDQEILSGQKQKIINKYLK